MNVQVPEMQTECVRGLECHAMHVICDFHKPDSVSQPQDRVARLSLRPHFVHFTPPAFDNNTDNSLDASRISSYCSSEQAFCPTDMTSLIPDPSLILPTY